MICPKCGHNNPSTVSKCIACGSNLGPNEAAEMFQKQAQNTKGIAVEFNNPSQDLDHCGSGQSNPGEYSLGGVVSRVREGQVAADDFFGELSSPPPPPPSLPSSAPMIPAVALNEPKGPDESFFAKGDPGEEPAFETDIQSLTAPEEEKPPEEHPLYTPPTNPHIEGYIARRAAARTKTG